MTAFSRRLFLGGLVGLAASSVVKTRTEVPILWGDLTHDDAPALNALFRGDPVRVLRGRAILGEKPMLAHASCLVASTIKIPKDAGITMLRNTIRTTTDFEGPILHFAGGHGGHVEGTRFYGRYRGDVPTVLMGRP